MRRHRSNRLHRLLVLSHRWLGLILGPVIILWCVSGAVMMYVGYPSLSEEQRRSCLPRLELDAVATLQWPPSLDDVTDAAIEQLDHQVVVRARTDEGIVTVPLGSSPLSMEGDQLTTFAQVFQRTCGRSDEVRVSEAIERDQWTVAGRFNRHRPLQRVSFDDSTSTELYVSSTTGEVVQRTTARERFWNAPGAVSHWFYLTALRQRPWLWSQVVIWTSVVSLYLIGVGAWLGARSWRWRRPERSKEHLNTRRRRGPLPTLRSRSPFKGVLGWHHTLSALSGLLLLTWTFSGLLSMNPWGWLEGEGDATERERLRWIAVDANGSAVARVPNQGVGSTALSSMRTLQALSTMSIATRKENPPVHLDLFPFARATVGDRDPSRWLSATVRRERSSCPPFATAARTRHSASACSGRARFR